MNRLVTCCIISLFVTSFGVAQHTICWDEARKLEWEDFKGEIDSTLTYIGKKAKAASFVRIVYKSHWKEGMPNYTFLNLFHTRISWVSDTTKSLLSHEQLHFDISELYARKARKSVDSLRSCGEKSLAVYSNIIKPILSELSQIQYNYDRETAHGVIASRQDIWNNKIARKMEELSIYTLSQEECEEAQN